MNRYAGEEAVVEQLRGVDDQGCRLAMLRHNGTALAAFAFRTRDLEYIGPAPPPLEPAMLAGDSRIVAGAQVVVRRHRPVNGDANWSSSMDEYVGKTATVVSLLGKDKAGCEVARISVNGQTVSNFSFRVRDLEFVSSSSTTGSSSFTGSSDLDGDSRIVEGAKVIVHKHRPVNGGSNWVSGMDRYVGKQAVVVRLSGRDGQQCKMAQLKVDDVVVTNYKFRCRDLEFVSGGVSLPTDLAGDSRIVPGAKVIIHRHRPVDGKTNWVSSMDRYAGKEATVVSLLGKDQAACEVARVAVDGAPVTSYSFRVRDLEFVSADSSLPTSLDGDPRVTMGAKVIIHRHRPVDGETNWVSGMDRYIGKQAVVLSITGKDRQQCKMAQLSVDDIKVTQYKFRCRDLELVVSDTSLAGDSRILPGVAVIIHKHRPVDGNLNWTSAMDAYVGKYAVVTELSGNDGAGCRVAHLVIEGEAVNFCFRVRDLELVGSGLVDSLEGDSRIHVGSTVIISRHRPVCNPFHILFFLMTCLSRPFVVVLKQVNGRENWTTEMNRYVGCRAVVKELCGQDNSSCALARLSVEGKVISRYSFRIRDLTLVPGGSPVSDTLSSGEVRVGSRVVIHRHRPVCCLLEPPPLSF